MGKPAKKPAKEPVKEEAKPLAMPLGLLASGVEADKCPRCAIRHDMTQGLVERVHACTALPDGAQVRLFTRPELEKALERAPVEQRGFIRALAEGHAHKAPLATKG